MKLQVVIQTLTCRKKPNLRDVLNVSPFCTLYLKSCTFFDFKVFILLFFLLQVWCERNKIPIVFVLSRFSKHEQGVNLGWEILYSVNVVGTNLVGLCCFLSPQRTSGHTTLTIQWLNDAVERATLDRELLFAAPLPSFRKHWHVPITQTSNQTLCH